MTGSSLTFFHRGQIWFCNQLLNTHIHSWPVYPLKHNQMCSSGRYLKIMWHLVVDEDACEDECHQGFGCVGLGISPLLAGQSASLK